MLVNERISAVVSLTLIGVALYFVLDFPAQVASIPLFGSPLALVSPRQWLMVVLLAGMAMAGTHTVVCTNPRLPTLRLGYLATFWMLPGLLVVLVTQTLGLAPTLVSWATGLVVVGLLLWLTIVAEFWQIFPQARSYFWPRLWRRFIGYVIALAFFIVIYQSRTRSALSATAIMGVGGMVALALLRQGPDLLLRSWLLAGAIGLGLAQLTWALNYWRTGALNAGLLLFLVFYVLVGLAQQQLVGTLSRRTVWEFGAIAAVGLIVVFIL